MPTKIINLPNKIFLFIKLEAVILNPSQRDTMSPHVDQLLRAVMMQMRMNFSTPLTEASTPERLKEVCCVG